MGPDHFRQAARRQSIRAILKEGREERKTEGRAFVTSLAVSEILSAEGAPVIVACHAALSARRQVMHLRDGRSDLPALRCSRAHVMAAGAIQTLARPVIGMAEIDAVRARRFRRAHKAAQTVTGAARRDIAPVRGLRARAVTLITGIVRAQARRDRERHAASGGFVTGGAALPHSPSVLRVIELRVKASERRKGFNCARLFVRMTDVADVAVRVIELLRMASGAGRVARKTRLRSVRLAPVAQETGQTRVRRMSMSEDGEAALRRVRACGISSRARINLFRHSRDARVED